MYDHLVRSVMFLSPHSSIIDEHQNKILSWHITFFNDGKFLKTVCSMSLKIMTTFPEMLTAFKSNTIILGSTKSLLMTVYYSSSYTTMTHSQPEDPKQAKRGKTGKKASIIMLSAVIGLLTLICLVGFTVAFIQLASLKKEVEQLKEAATAGMIGKANQFHMNKNCITRFIDIIDKLFYAA